MDIPKNSKIRYLEGNWNHTRYHCATHPGSDSQVSSDTCGWWKVESLSEYVTQQIMWTVTAPLHFARKHASKVHSAS